MFAIVKLSDAPVLMASISQDEFSVAENLPDEKVYLPPSELMEAGGPFTTTVRMLPSPIAHADENFPEKSENEERESSRETRSCAAAPVLEVAKYAIAASERNRLKISIVSIESCARKKTGFMRWSLR